ncbi:raffinose/stachyose/melibiose transport system substrate-binding protein [Malonomonas rubra DSM 5091]|uniref:Raffinose/stachyose/melibiose transport system substrate-binding protein n=1 Tax=Malonomonas rubra DSM 5091 TaxID=1122189 RepID=A0A1M6JA73_MALRU|nr:extracellular solute-binding protein [Malonomonas rubra]SHJ43571.1 raffinose/stachyose/melibiose transport system substrate-binding protein [Malonomonas rubra DSM 5091]
MPSGMKVFLLVVFLSFCGGGVAFAQKEQVSVLHYFADDMGRAGIKTIFERFSEQRKIAVVDNPVGHEEFKTVSLQMAAEGQLPGVVSYWGGARTQFLVDSGVLEPLDDLWQRGNFSALVNSSLADEATLYNGQRYLIPFGYHAAGFFYNPHVFKKAGIDHPPETWDQFLETCQRLQQAGIPPLALGARNRWPAQFWFDYLLLRTAGPEFRKKLMSGDELYTAGQVEKVMRIWAELLQKGYFASGYKVDDWGDSADRVAAGRAGMVLMGTWVSGYWADKGLAAEADYDFFPFPVIDPQQPKAVVGPVDGLVMGANAPHREEAAQLIEFLLTDLESQQQWALAQGALSPNIKVSAEIYNPVLRKVAAEVENAESFVFNYDLATTPPAAEQGLMLFSNFLADPQNYQQLLRNTDSLVGPVLRARKKDAASPR